MDETNRNSTKLDIEAVRLSAAEEVIPKETYKTLSEVDGLENGKSVSEAVKNSNMVREKTDSIEDGADERMLNAGGPGGDEKERLAHKDEVKFIAGDQQNGDAKIDIGNVEKAFSAMTKDELMKFTNDPFWVRLRWILFILFWGLWVAMLVGAILIIIDAPKCAAPEPLPWWKQGPFAKLSWNEPQSEKSIADLKSYGVNGVVIPIPPQDTYSIESNEDTQKNIKQLVETYKAKDISVILDITPNYVQSSDEFFKKALAGGEDERAAFGGWADQTKTNWKRIDNSGSAWELVGSNSYVLSQFGKGLYDLQLKNDMAKDRLKNVLIKLCELGVKGIRLNNAKHYIIGKLENEEVSTVVNPNLEDYHSYTHQHSTYQEGLGKLLYELHETVKNATNNDGFLSIAGEYERIDFMHRINSTEFNIDLPKYGLFPTSVAQNKAGDALESELKNTINTLKPIPTSDKGLNSKTLWPQWELNDINDLRNISASEFNMFMMFLPGIPILPAEMYYFGNHSENFFKMANAIRNSPSFMHGSFDLYSNKSTIAYTRLKSGSPGYFVIYNPSEVDVSVNYSYIKDMAEHITVHALSDNYSGSLELKGKVRSDDISISKFSTIVLTYVPPQ